MDIATSTIARRKFRRRPVRSRPDQPLFDGTWRRYMTASLARKVAAMPVPEVDKVSDPSPVGDPRMCWTPATAEGHVWPQPARCFA